MQSFMLSSKSAQFLEYMELRTRTIASMCQRHLYGTSHYPTSSTLTPVMDSLKPVWSLAFWLRLLIRGVS